MNSTSSNPFTRPILQTGSVAQAPTQVRLNFIRKTYLLFMAGLLAAIVGGAICVSTPLEALIIGLPWFVTFLLYLGVAIGAISLMRREGWNYVALFGFTAFDGILLAPWLKYCERFSPGILGQAAFLTIMVFGALTAYAFITQRDFSYWGGALSVGLSALIIAEMANIFIFHSAGAGYWLAWITVVLFSGYILYDTSQIIHRYQEQDYCLAALSLYLDFIIMFQAIVEILSNGQDNE